jgi:hypothetical protein
MGISVAASVMTGIHGTTGAGPSIHLNSSNNAAVEFLQPDNRFGSKRLHVALEDFILDILAGTPKEANEEMKLLSGFFTLKIPHSFACQRI